MSKTYTIRPLVFREAFGFEGKVAVSVCGQYQMHHAGEDVWQCAFPDSKDFRQYRSWEIAEQMAQAHYRAFIEQAIEEVK